MLNQANTLRYVLGTLTLSVLFGTLQVHHLIGKIPSAIDEVLIVAFAPLAYFVFGMLMVAICETLVCGRRWASILVPAVPLVVVYVVFEGVYRLAYRGPLTTVSRLLELEAGFIFYTLHLGAYFVSLWIPALLWWGNRFSSGRVALACSLLSSAALALLFVVH